MPNFLLETFPKVLSIKSWSSSLHFTSWNILSKTLLFRNMSLFLWGGWVVKFLTLSHFCHMSFFGGGGWVLEEIWSMSLNNPGFFWYLSLTKPDQLDPTIWYNQPNTTNLTWPNQPHTQDLINQTKTDPTNQPNLTNPTRSTYPDLTNPTIPTLQPSQPKVLSKTQHDIPNLT